ncbi:MAG: fasciclin domain-containing protein [Bacteroidales bacterium]|nr:fasciclin domain-containing protein [Bacteroidales bacterium]
MNIRLFLLTSCIVLCIACEKETALEEYYYQEGNFSGSIYDALDSTGLFNYFIQGIDSSEIANQLKNTLVTVVAPSDQAFEAYFAKHGYGSLSDIPISELQDLIGHHVITWPNSPTSFEIDPLYFKRQTNMAQRTEVKYDPFDQIDRTVVKEAKYLQFYFQEMFDYYGLTNEDYRLLSGTDLSPATGFNIYHSPVDSIVPYGNGWIYYVDEVIEPVQNLDDWLLSGEDYSLFRTLFERYSLYYVDGSVSNSVPVKRSNVFQNNRYYRIDMELCFETVGYIKKGGSLISLKASSGHTVLAPHNNVLQDFIDLYFQNYPGFGESIFTVDKYTLDGIHIHNIVRSIIAPYLFVGQTLFPSNFFSEGGINALDGTNIKLNQENIDDYTLCSNGYAYGVNTFVVPRTFRSILKPVFTSPDYKYFTAAVLAAKISGYLNDVKANYTLMLPTDSAFIKNNILLLDVNTYNNDYGGSIDPTQGLNETVFLDLRSGQAERMDVQGLFDIVFSHLFTEDIALSSEKQYAKSVLGSYVGFTRDSVWSGGNMEERWGLGIPEIPDVIMDLTGAGTDNGSVYVVNDLIKSPTYSVGRMLLTNPAYSRFAELCESSGLLSADGTLTVYGNYPTVFVPTNAAIDQFISEGKLPVEEDELLAFIKYFFVDRDVFTSESINETVPTLCKDEELSSEFSIVYKTVALNGSPGNLQIKGIHNSSFLDVISGEESDIICSNGIIHLVDGVLN